MANMALVSGPGSTNIDDAGDTNPAGKVYVSYTGNLEIANDSNVKNVNTIAKENHIFGIGDTKDSGISPYDNQTADRVSYNKYGSSKPYTYRKWVSTGAGQELEYEYCDKTIYKLDNTYNYAKNIYASQGDMAGKELEEMFFFGAHGIPAATKISTDEKTIEGRSWRVLYY